jgi:hypothetical protein
MTAKMRPTKSIVERIKSGEGEPGQPPSITRGTPLTPKEWEDNALRLEAIIDQLVRAGEALLPLVPKRHHPADTPQAVSDMERALVRGRRLW